MAKKAPEVAGHIGADGPPPSAADAALEEARQKALKGDNIIWDGQRGLFYFHGAHPSLVGIEATVAVDLPAILNAASIVTQQTVIPILTGQLEIKRTAKGVIE